MCLKGKRLLVLGGTYNLQTIREYAEKNGVIIIATGNKKDHPLCTVASEYYPANVKDPDELKKLIQEHHIDGVFAGGNEDIIEVIFDVVKDTDLYFYATKEQWDITCNKKRFKRIASQAGLPTVKEFKLSADGTAGDEKIEFPVVIKPVDGSGSQGVYLCETYEELTKAREEAMCFSRSKELIAEKFMSGFITVFYMTIIEGEIYIESMADKYTKPSADGSLVMPTIAQVYLYPSRHIDNYIEKYLPAIKKLLELLDIKNGVVGIQGFCDGENVVFTEMGYRLGGTSQQNYTKALHGSDNMELLMNYALTGEMTHKQYYSNPFFEKTCVTIQLISKGGKIASVYGVDEVKRFPEVISFEEHYSVGDTIPVIDNVSMVHFRIFVVAESIEHAQQIIATIQNTIKVYDADGESMLDDAFDVQRLGTQ